MNILNLLSSNNFIDFAVEKVGSVGLNWIGKIIRGLFEAFGGIYGGAILGVVIFTIILKTIVLPLDAYSRVKTKKQALIMESMRPQMEKLKKQYANDNQLYSQKVMELQKANGYSPLAACLPMFVSLIIFIIVIGAFSTYSNYAIIKTYNGMVDAYNASVQTYVCQVYKLDENGKKVADPDAETHENGFLTYDFYFAEDGHVISEGYKADYKKFEKIFYDEYNKQLAANNDDETKIDTSLKDIKELYEKGKTLLKDGEENNSTMEEALVFYVQLNARREAAKNYRENRGTNTLGWIGNVWYPDSMLNKVVPEYSKFKSSISRAASTGAMDYEESYNEVTYYLRNTDPANPNVKLEGKTYNGYFVLIVLAIGLMFLQQFITTRSQKATTELSSVDGSAAKTNKWMMILMPIIYGAFSFFYSAAFSTYMIINTCYGLITTLIINKIVAVYFDKHGFKPPKKKLAANNRKRLK